jgi:alpha-glucosidase (family GH31 glycosyl hydrolase)
VQDQQAQVKVNAQQAQVVQAVQVKEVRAQAAQVAQVKAAVRAQVDSHQLALQAAVQLVQVQPVVAETQPALLVAAANRVVLRRRSRSAPSVKNSTTSQHQYLVEFRFNLVAVQQFACLAVHL